MAHFPRPGVPMRITLALILAAGYAAALFALLVFLSDQCAIGYEGTGYNLWPAARLNARDLAPFAVLWVAFSVVELPAVLYGPGLRARLFKRASFALLLAGTALALLLGPTPNCETGGSPLGTAWMVLILGVLAAVGLWIYVRRRIPRDANLTRLTGGERKSDSVRRGR